MSDTGRQSLTDKAGAAIKPDSQKSTTEHLGDKFKGNTDSAASTLQPNVRETSLCHYIAHLHLIQSEKSAGQRAGDTLAETPTTTRLPSPRRPRTPSALVTS
ncbi:heat shock protein 9/12-domain-containing protein, partial [Infundibulicybe gibba]